MTPDSVSPSPPGAAHTAGSTATVLVALTVATLLHAALIMLVAIRTPGPQTGADAASGADTAMEILILSGESVDTEAFPAEPITSQRDWIAASADAGSALAEPIVPATDDATADALRDAVVERPIQVADETLDAPATRLEVDPEPEPDSVDIEEVIVEPDPERLPAAPVDAPDPMAPREPKIDAARILASRGEEIGRLIADQEARSIAYASRVRRKSISAGTHEFRYASYLSAWAHKVERIGNLNYPQAARDQRMFGSLVLQVAVKSDGSLERIRVVRSSGYDLLDEAAVRIVELAAPFAPFPPDIAAETDVLDIVRTWQFLQGGRLGWEQP